MRTGKVRIITTKLLQRRHFKVKVTFFLIFNSSQSVSRYNSKNFVPCKLGRYLDIGYNFPAHIKRAFIVNLKKPSRIYIIVKKVQLDKASQV